MPVDGCCVFLCHDWHVGKIAVGMVSFVEKESVGCSVGKMVGIVVVVEFVGCFVDKMVELVVVVGKEHSVVFVEEQVAVVVALVFVDLFAMPDSCSVGIMSTTVLLTWRLS